MLRTVGGHARSMLSGVRLVTKSKSASFSRTVVAFEHQIPSQNQVIEDASKNPPSAKVSIPETDPKAAQDLGQILSVVETNSKLYLNEACDLLRTVALHADGKTIASETVQAMSSDKKQDLEGAKKNLARLFETLSGKVESRNVSTKALISCLKSLDQLGVPPSTFCVQNIENGLTWRARSTPMGDLTMMLSFSVGRKDNSDCAKKFYDEVIRCIGRRWIELEEARHFIGIMHYSEHFDEKLLANLEDTLIEKVDGMSTENWVVILREFSKAKRRSVPVLKALAYHLARTKDPLNLKQISDILFSFSQLAYKDLSLIESVCFKGVALLGEIDADDDSNSAVLRSITTSLGQLKYRDTALLDKIADHLSTRLQAKGSLDSRDLVPFLLTSATLNYAPKNSEAVFTQMKESLTWEEVSKSSGKNAAPLYLDIVWSLAVLNQCESRHFEHVLTSDFLEKLMNVRRQHVGTILKLLNVNAAAKHLVKDYNGPTLEIEQNSQLSVRPSQKVDRTQLLANIFDAFHSLASPPSFLIKDINTGMGFILDAEAVFESATAKPHGSILEIGLLGRNVVPSEDLPPAKPLPSGTKRVGLMILAFNDCLLGDTKELTGLIGLCKRLLESLDYSVMIVRHDDVKHNHQKLEKVKILEAKLKTVLSSKSD